VSTRWDAALPGLAVGAHPLVCNYASGLSLHQPDILTVNSDQRAYGSIEPCPTAPRSRRRGDVWRAAGGVGCPPDVMRRCPRGLGTIRRSIIFQ